MTTNQEWLARRQKAVPRGVATAMPIFAAHAENAELWDVEGRRYLDFAGGIAVLNTGHRHPKVMQWVEEQSRHFTHTAFQVIGYETYIRLAEKLNALGPTGAENKTIFFTTGAEAVENAVKIARVATGRTAVIAFGGGFHGRTMMTLALTGKVEPYKTGFGPFPGDVYHAPFPNPLHGVSEADSLKAIQNLLKFDVEPRRVAAIILEPVQGEGGFYIASPHFLQELRALCDRHGILLIADEVQSGIARTGKMFAIEHSGVTPDLLTVAKSLAGGFPLSAVIGKAEIMDKVGPGGLGGTYGGSPVACAAALGVLDAIESDQLLQRADGIGKTVSGFLSNLARRNQFACIGDVRGLGAMIAFELVKDRSSNTPDPDLTKALTAKALEKGLILLSCGLYSNVIRLLMPLTIADRHLEEGLGIIEESLGQVAV